MLQLPQYSGLVPRSTHKLPQSVSPDGQTHSPETHVVVPGQVVPHVPQWSRSLSRSTHVVPPQSGQQTFAVPPPPQICGALHVPQSRLPPQPSGIDPQFFPCAWHVVGVQQVPKIATPRCDVGLKHRRLQQLTFVWQRWPDALQDPARATGTQTPNTAMKTRRAGRNDERLVGIREVSSVVADLRAADGAMSTRGQPP